MTVETALEEIEKATGLVGFIVLGGPEPRCSGNLMVMSYVFLLNALEQLLMDLRYHTGKTEGGLDFSESYDAWKSNIEEPFVGHLNDIFCKDTPIYFLHQCINHFLAHEACLARALPSRTAPNINIPPPTRSSSLPSHNITNVRSIVGAFSLRIK